MQSHEGVTLLIAFSSGDLGDVGRHCVGLALKHPRVRHVYVMTDQPPQHLFDQSCYKKCTCPPKTHDLLPFKDRLTVLRANVLFDDLSPHVQSVDAVISCLGNRLPFHTDSKSHIAEYGTSQLVRALLDLDKTRQRLIMLSSVGIGNDWPPLKGLREGSFLEGLFRTICWKQYQDLSEAERTLHRSWSSNQLDYLTARCVLLPDECQPTGCFRVIDQPQDIEQRKRACPGAIDLEVEGDGFRAGFDYDQQISKLDAAQFLIQEAVFPSLHRQVVILGGVPKPLASSLVTATNADDGKKKTAFRI